MISNSRYHKQALLELKFQNNGDYTQQMNNQISNQKETNSMKISISLSSDDENEFL
jgi:hypothetical protein